LVARGSGHGARQHDDVDSTVVGNASAPDREYGGEMADLAEFNRRQRDAGRRLEAAYGRLASSRIAYGSAAAAIVPHLNAAPPDQAMRASILAQHLAEPQRVAADASQRETQEIMSATAELSENWTTHEALWDSATSAEILGAGQAMGRQRESTTRARESTTAFRQSLGNFAALGPEADEGARSLLAALGGEYAALAEVQTLLDTQSETIERAIRRRRD
jgi:uncharacterized protein YfiM (DUF2279 family)